MEDSHIKDANTVLEELAVNIEEGLNKKEVELRRLKYGHNEFSTEKGKTWWNMLMEQFEDPLVQILLFSALISFLFGLFESPKEKATSLIETLVILIILIVNGVIGIFQEVKAERAIEALKMYYGDKITVIREKQEKKIDSKELVPGDIVYLHQGDKIPADIRLVRILSYSFRVNQSILTGESESVSKDVKRVKDIKAIYQDKVNILFSGTMVTIGHGIGIVVLTGNLTAIGSIREELLRIETEPSPLKRKLNEFSRFLTLIISIICIMVWILNIPNFSNIQYGGLIYGGIYYFKISIALAVAAIPEGLPMIITTCLALGAIKLSKKKVIIRCLDSIETLGCITMICSDKTGTLTMNQMSLNSFFIIKNELGDLIEFEVEGMGYEPNGEIKVKNQEERGGKEIPLCLKYDMVSEMAEICSICNYSKIIYNERSDNYECLGEPTEGALRVFVEKLGTQEENWNTMKKKLDITKDYTYCNSYYEAMYEKLKWLDFSRDRKSMSVLVRKKEIRNDTWYTEIKHRNDSIYGRMMTDTNNSNLCEIISNPGKEISLFVKGAPEAILERCKWARINEFSNLSGNGSKEKKITVLLTKEMKESILKKLNEYTKEKALRCLALAKVDHDYLNSKNTLEDEKDFIQYEKDMTFIGVVGMLDLPRSEIHLSIEACHEAGIRVIILTGDHQNTAESICQRIGLLPFHKIEQKEYSKKVSFTGREFDDMNLSERHEMINDIVVFSRTEPHHKSELIDLLQHQGHIVAMTGDGVNDAPALKKANVGIAMGSGTSVAREASDMILLDDNFIHIVEAIFQGRSIYSNMKQFIRYLISSNLGEVMCIFLSVLLGLPGSLIPVQLLWVNLVTDGLPATALGFNPIDKDIRYQPPRKMNESIVNFWLFLRYLAIGRKFKLRMKPYI
jgi:Ca2+ transporting ATPase